MARACDMSKFSLIARLQHWMDSVPGQTFMNYAYSWGAAVVILGTLFKLTHIPGANAMLFIGMGTEVFVFFIAGFDRPFDAKKDTELADDFVDLEELEQLKHAAQVAVSQPVVAGGGVVVGGGAPADATASVAGGGAGTIVIGSGGVAPAAGQTAGEADTAQPQGAAQAGAVVGGSGTIIIGGPLQQAAGQIDLATAEAINPEEVGQAVDDYVEQLQQLSAVLAKVRERAEKLTGDNEEMLNLGRTLTGIATIYEMQLKSVSQQVGTIDQINDQTRLMAKQIEELNAVYASMIKALTVGSAKAAPQE